MWNAAQLPAEPEPHRCFATGSEPSIDDRSLNETVHFVLPRRALAAIDPIAIVAEARRDGINGRRMGVDDRGAGVDETHLTCGFTMAVRVVHAIERAEALAARQSDVPLALALASASRSAITALGSRVQRA